MGQKVDFVCLVATMPGRHSGDQVHKVKKSAAPLLLFYGCRYTNEVGRGLLNASSPYYNASAVDAALAHAFKVRMRLGLFDPAKNQPFAHYGPDVVGSAAYALFYLFASFLCNGGKSRLCVLGRHYAGTA